MRACGRAEWLVRRGADVGLVAVEVRRVLLAEADPQRARWGMLVATGDDALRLAAHRAAACALAQGDLERARRIVDVAAPLARPPRCRLWALSCWVRSITS